MSRLLTGCEMRKRGRFRKGWDTGDDGPSDFVCGFSCGPSGVLSFRVRVYDHDWNAFSCGAVESAMSEHKV